MISVSAQRVRSSRLSDHFWLFLVFLDLVAKRCELISVSQLRVVQNHPITALSGCSALTVSPTAQSAAVAAGRYPLITSSKHPHMRSHSILLRDTSTSPDHHSPTWASAAVSEAKPLWPPWHLLNLLQTSRRNRPKIVGCFWRDFWF